mgnify:CR=1 FL=1
MKLTVNYSVNDRGTFHFDVQEEEKKLIDINFENLIYNNFEFAAGQIAATIQGRLLREKPKQEAQDATTD